MKRVPLDDVAAGETAARPVVAASGVVLVRPGTVLQAETLRRLAQLGIEAVWLHGPAGDSRPVEEALSDLDDRFAGHEDDELMMDLKALVASRLARGGC